MKELSYYTDYGTRPRKSDFTKYFVYSKGKVIVNGLLNPSEDLRAEWRNKGYSVETEVDDVAYRTATLAHVTNMNRLSDEFKADLFADYDVSGPKAEKAYKIAYDERHSSGLHEVVDLFDDLAELIK